MDVLQQSLAIAFVFTLLWAALWFLRKVGTVRIRLRKGRAKGGVLESRGKLILGPQNSIHVVRVGERELVLAAHSSGVTLLCDLGRGSADGHAAESGARIADGAAGWPTLMATARAAGTSGDA